MTSPRVSIVVPALNAESTLEQSLRAIESQNVPATDRELIVVVDTRSGDRTLEIALSHPDFTVVRHGGPNAASARNAGMAVAAGTWVAFTDADCFAVRGWLRALVEAAEAAGSEGIQALGAAGQLIGYESATPAARYVDLTGGLRADKHLEHTRYPWAPTANVLYRRDALMEVAGFDERFDSYEGCDLHTRLLRTVGGEFVYAPHAVTYHRHRAGWRSYWRQQRGYGRGYAQFFLRYDSELGWNARHEARAWLRLCGSGARALTSWSGDEALVKHGTFVKGFAQRIGFVSTFWRPSEARRWNVGPASQAESAT